MWSPASRRFSFSWIFFTCRGRGGEASSAGKWGPRLNPTGHSVLVSTLGVSSQTLALCPTLSFCFSVSRLLSSSRSYSVISTFLSQSRMRRGNSVSSVSRQAGMTASHTQGSVQHLHMQLHTLDTAPVRSHRSPELATTFAL